MGQPRQLQTLRRMVEMNGPIWTFYASAYVAARKLKRNLRIPPLDRRIKDLEQRLGLPGMNSSELQFLIWEAWDWDSGDSEEWTQSEEWKQSVVRHVLLPRVPDDSDVLEIGPGAGRWTETLLDVAGSLTLVDISERCIKICRKKFGHLDYLSFYVTPNSDLSFVADESVDIVWSFDVFVHIAPDDIAGYIAEFGRVLRPGGRGVIHHADEGGLQGGWRSSMTADMFRIIAERNCLAVVEQFDSWGESGRFDVRYYHDTISVIEKHARRADSQELSEAGSNPASRAAHS